jgi:hypothetical protein
VSRFPEIPTVKIMALGGVIVAPGVVARSGEIIEVPEHVAKRLVAMRQARPLTAADQAQIINADPTPIHRDPTPSKRKR